jgi:hypothetical protein
VNAEIESVTDTATENETAAEIATENENEIATVAKNANALGHDRVQEIEMAARTANETAAQAHVVIDDDIRSSLWSCPCTCPILSSRYTMIGKINVVDRKSDSNRYLIAGLGALQKTSDSN